LRFRVPIRSTKSINDIIEIMIKVHRESVFKRRTVAIYLGMLLANLQPN
jgi:hypothetical protein